MKEPLGPPSPLEVAKVVSKPIVSVPTKHFGTLLASILEPFSFLFCIVVFQ